MQLAKIRRSGVEGVAIVDGDRLAPLSLSSAYPTLSAILEAPDPRSVANSFLAPDAPRYALDQVQLLAPLDQQEVWAAGVTYRRSQAARMEESQGAAAFYDQVYSASRPELFFKATPHRVVGPSEPVRVRQDSRWNVPEPELALVLNSHMRLVAFTIGNDMSSRDIEGENPLYLPQAKVYDGCCALGPWLTLAADMPPREQIGIELAIERAGRRVFSGSTSIAQMARTFEDLISWLARDNSFPQGVILLTGTGIVPGSELSLAAGDVVQIHVDGIGTLCNPVVQESER